GEDGELQRQAARLVDAVLHALGEIAQMGVAGGELRPGVADADYRPAVEQVGGQALVLHPGAVIDVVARRAAEPLLRTEFPRPGFWGEGGHSISFPVRRPGRGLP